MFGTAGQVAGQAYYDALAAQRSLAASRQVAELAAQTMFQAYRVRAAGGHAQGHGAVVQAPARRVRHVELRTEAAVGVDVRAEEGHPRFISSSQGISR